MDNSIRGKEVYYRTKIREKRASKRVRALIDEIGQANILEDFGINGDELNGLIDVYGEDCSKLSISLFKLGYQRGLAVATKEVVS